MQLHTENVTGIENKLQRYSIKIRNGVWEFIPITNISPHIYEVSSQINNRLCYLLTVL